MDPFGGQPFGGWAQPPTYQAPPPQQQPTTNRFARLSVVFAVVVAPLSALYRAYHSYRGTAAPQTSGIDVVKANLDKIA
ncbi:hypothetical protein A5784_27210 [Mycobacterium sp. 852013-50091_SCH5140682]|nr:hypothetical protein A5784_27210 [Mycobacterium sp. 852013-50091_SCH5140682]